MRLGGLAPREVLISLAIAGSLLTLPLGRSVHAAPPVVTLGAKGVRVEVASAPLSEAIEALSRAAGFKVTYEGPRPSAMLFNAEIRAPTVAEALLRLLNGQNLNYGVVFDHTGRRVTLLMVLGPASKRGAVPTAVPASPGPGPFTPPPNRRNNPPLLDQDPDEVEPPEPEPAPPEPTPEASPPLNGPEGPSGGQTVVLPPSPFVPRSLVVSPFAPRPTPSPSPSS